MLDNPAWSALTTTQASFAQGTDLAKRYTKGILPFIACKTDRQGIPADALEELDPFIEPGESFYFIGRLPVLPRGWTHESELPCAQMILSGPIPTPTGTPAIEPLGASNAEEMFDLVHRVQPGYYNLETHLLGSYFGIRQQGRLVAIAGERMRLATSRGQMRHPAPDTPPRTGYSELSAICTDPAYTGRGYAHSLIAYLSQMHARAGVISYLHVALTNKRAIRLYEHLGFRHRREISFWRCRKH